MGTPAQAHNGFADIAAKSVSNALCTHSDELQRRGFRVSFPNQARSGSASSLALSCADEHFAGDYYTIDITDQGYSVTISVDHTHMSTTRE